MRTLARRPFSVLPVGGVLQDAGVYRWGQRGAVTAAAGSPYMVRNGSPWLMVADSGGGMINILPVAADGYFADRQARGFNAVLVHILTADYNGGRADGTTVDGIKPFTSGSTPADYDLATTNPAYWQRIDDFCARANQHNIVMLLDAVETGSWLVTLQNNGSTKAFNYGVFLANRFRNRDLIWWFGNDFGLGSPPTTADQNLALQVLNGINSVDPAHLQTSQMNYFVSASLDSSIMAPRITLNGVYSYRPTYAETLAARAESATVPIYFQEGNFENANLPTPAENGTPAVIRRQNWWAMLSGASGVTYGENSIHSFQTGWQSHLGDTGVTQMGYMKTFLQALPWHTFVPDSGHTVLTGGYRTFDSACSQCVGTNDYAACARSADGSTVAVFAPTTGTLTVDMTKLAGSSVTAKWFDPSANSYATVSGQPFANTGSRTFTPTGNNSSGATDWVLLLTS